MKARRATVKSRVRVPGDEAEAVGWILPLLDQSPQTLTATPAVNLKKAWAAIAFIYTGLHPDDAREHGQTTVEIRAGGNPDMRRLDPRLTTPCHAESGWPVVLIPLAAEAWRRYDMGLLADDEYYCCEAQMAGCRSRCASSAHGAG